MKGSSHHNLPPTSQGLLPHIKRSFYNAYTIMHALEIHHYPDVAMLLKPEDCGYEHDKEQLIPDKEHHGKPLNPIGRLSVHALSVPQLALVGLLMPKVSISVNARRHPPALAKIPWLDKESRNR